MDLAANSRTICRSIFCSAVKLNCMRETSYVLIGVMFLSTIVPHQTLGFQAL